MNRRGLRATVVLAAVAILAALPWTEPSQAAVGAPDQVAYVDSNGWWRIPRPGQADYTFQMTLPSGAHTIFGWYLADWNGDGFDTPGVRYIHGSSVDLGWINTLPADGASVTVDLVEFSSGQWGSGQPMFGDWDGDGIETLGWDAGFPGQRGIGQMVLGNGWPDGPGGKSSGYDGTQTPTWLFWFGRGFVRGDIPLHGDWDGNGIDTIGIYRVGESKVYYSNMNPTVRDAVATTDGQFWFGVRGDIPLVGDWNGDGRDTVGVYRPFDNTFYFRNYLTTGPGSTYPGRAGTPFAGRLLP